ncbi:MAG: flagellar basal body protein, partial [Mariprofundus sp.]
MIFDSLNIAASSLKTQQKAIDVVSNNIANVNTPGYSRQVANVTSVASQQQGGLNFGRGVDITSVTRIVDPLINNALLGNSSQKGYWTTLNNGLNTVENVFGSLQSTGLSAALNDFFLS